MTLNIQDIKRKWTRDRPKYDDLGNIISHFIKSNINNLEILPEITHRTKELISIIKKIKKKQIEKDYSYNDLNDKLGIRIICDFQEDMVKVDTFLKNYFEVKKAEYKQEELDFDKLGYISNHYDLTIKPNISDFTQFKKYKNIIFEVQVRTLNQHAWSNTAHKLSYKQSINLPPKVKRKIYRLLSLYEIADDEFSSVNELLSKRPDNLSYALINRLEGKIFKFANIDYDREISVFNFNILLSYFTDKNQEYIFDNIETFISANSNKISNIFTENKNRYYEIPILTQPEIFLIWFALEYFEFSIIENWEDNFALSELEQVALLWGKTIE